MESFPTLISENHLQETNKNFLSVEILTSPGTTNKVAKNWNKQKRPVKGFRPGNVPKKVIEQVVGKDKLYFDEMVQQYHVIREEKGYYTTNDPDLYEWHEENDGGLRFKIKIELLDDFDVTENNYLGLEVEKDEPSEEKALDAYENFLRSTERQLGSYKPVERATQAGDHVTINLETFVDNQPFPDLSVQSRQVQVDSTILGHELEAAIIGTNVDEKKTIELTFASDRPHPKLKNKTATLTFSLEAIKELVPHPRNDDLAKQTKLADTLEELKVKCVADHKKTQEEAGQRIFELSCMEAVSRKIGLNIPQNMINNELSGMVRYRIDMFQKMGLPKDQALQNLDFQILNAQAKCRLSTALIFDKLCRKQIFKLEDVSQEEIDQSIIKKAKDYDTSEEDLKKKYATAQNLSSLKKEILYDKFVETVVKSAKPIPKRPEVEETVVQTNEPTEETSAESEVVLTESVQ